MTTKKKKGLSIRILQKVFTKRIEELQARKRLLCRQMGDLEYPVSEKAASAAFVAALDAEIEGVRWAMDQLPE